MDQNLAGYNFLNNFSYNKPINNQYFNYNQMNAQMAGQINPNYYPIHNLNGQSIDY